MARTFASLKFRNYRLWFFSSLVASTGIWMQVIAQDWVVLTQLTNNSAIAVGIVSALQFGPTLLIGPWAGVLADRLNRRKILMMTQGANALFSLLLGVLLLTGLAQLWQVYLISLITGFISAFDSPARNTFVSELVAPQHLSNAVALNSTSFNAARLIGPAVSGVAMAAIGAGWVFVLTAVIFATPILGMALMRTAEFHFVARIPKEKGALRAGLAYAWHRSDIMVLMFVVALVSGLGFNFQLTIAVMVRQVFDADAGMLGALSSVLAVGTLLGSLLAARYQNPRARTVIVFAGVFAVFEGALAVMPNIVTFAIMLVPTGLALMMTLIIAAACVQMNTAEEMRGRVMSLYNMVFLGVTPFTSPMIGWLAEVAGPRWSIGIGSIGSLFAAIVAGLFAWRAWHVKIKYDFPFHLSTIGPRERYQLSLSEASSEASDSVASEALNPEASDSEVSSETPNSEPR